MRVFSHSGVAETVKYRGSDRVGTGKRKRLKLTHGIPDGNDTMTAPVSTKLRSKRGKSDPEDTAAESFEGRKLASLGHTMNSDSLLTREVWAENLDEELAIIRGIVDEYPFIAMDTEFPGVVRALGCKHSATQIHVTDLRRLCWVLFVFGGPARLADSQCTLLKFVASQVARPVGSYKFPSEFQYQTLRYDACLS
jgi:hypothetical protein